MFGTGKNKAEIPALGTVAEEDGAICIGKSKRTKGPLFVARADEPPAGHNYHGEPIGWDWGEAVELARAKSKETGQHWRLPEPREARKFFNREAGVSGFTTKLYPHNLYWTFGLVKNKKYDWSVLQAKAFSSVSGSKATDASYRKHSVRLVRD